MEVNQYESPMSANQPPPRVGEAVTNIANIGLVLSLIGLVGVAVVGWTSPIISIIGMYLAFVCLPGTVLSFVGYLLRPNRIAALGITIGVFGSFYLPTFWLTLRGHI
jgi:hypothetical protein